jgi:hypothetical protein
LFFETGQLVSWISSSISWIPESVQPQSTSNILICGKAFLSGLKKLQTPKVKVILFTSKNLKNYELRYNLSQLYLNSKFLRFFEASKITPT